MGPRPARWRPSPDDLRGLLLPVTAASCCWAARIERAAALVPPVGHPASHHVTGHERRPAHRNKSGRPRARTTQVTYCMRAPPAGAVAHGPMATAVSQAKSQLREGRRRWSTAVSQSCPERRASSCKRDRRSHVKRLTGWQLLFRAQAPSGPHANYPQAAHRWQGTTGGQAPQYPAPAKIPRKVLTSVPPQISSTTPMVFRPLSPVFRGTSESSHDRRRNSVIATSVAVYESMTLCRGSSSGARNRKLVRHWDVLTHGSAVKRSEHAAN